MSISSDSSKLSSNGQHNHLLTSVFKSVDPASLKPHEFNSSIYGATEDVSDLVDFIRNSQWVKPLVINQQNTIISGHRRWKAVQLLGWQSIPVEVREFSSPEAELEALLLENASRSKTTEQKVREALAWEQVEKARAKQRQQLAAATTNKKLGRDNKETLVENFPQASGGKSRDRVATLVGLGSGRTYSKAKKVVAAIDKLLQQGNTESASSLRKVLNERSVDAATRFLKESSSNQNAEETTVQERSCWNCQYCSREPVKDNHSFYCYKFGFLSFLEKDAQTRASECQGWNYRWSESAKNKSIPNSSYFTLTLPSHLQPIFEDAARASGMTLVDWACHHLLQAAESTKTVLEV